MQYQRPPPPPPPRPPVVPEKERRHHPRLALEKVRVRVVNGEMDDLSGAVNLARRLINVSQGGVCIEASGRIRPDVRLNLEVRFDEFGGTLRSPAQVVWTDIVNPGGGETHLMGLKFLQPEISSTVREFLDGGHASRIVAKRRAEYEELKEKSEKRKVAAARKPWSATKKILVSGLVLVFLYLAGFGGLVVAGRRESPDAAVHYRYLGPQSTGEGSSEETLAKLYSPLVWAARKAGIDLAYDAPVTSK